MNIDKWVFPEQAGIRIGDWWFVWYRTAWRPLSDRPGKAHRLGIHRSRGGAA